MRPVVIDCSAIVPCFLPEQETQQFDGLLTEIFQASVVGIAPSILRLEFLSVALKKMRRGLCDPQLVAGQIQRFSILPFHYESDPALERGAFDLAVEQSIAVYDACYLWLALHAHCELATADIRLRQAAESLGVKLYHS